GADGGRIRSARVTFFGSVSLPWWLECSVALGQLGSKLSVHLDWRGYTAEHRTFDRRKREGCKMISRSGVVRADIRGHGKTCAHRIDELDVGRGDLSRIRMRIRRQPEQHQSNRRARGRHGLNI